MAQTQVLNRRIRSVKNAKQITKAMEVVAASRMRRVQVAVNSARAYAEVADSIIRNIVPSPEAKRHPYFKQNPASSRLYIIFTSDRGLAGAFNSNVIKAASNLIDQDKSSRIPASAIVFGRKGARFFARLEYVELVGHYENVDDAPEANVFAPVLETLKSSFTDGKFDNVVLVYTEFVSALSQQVRTKQLLPIQLPEVEDGKSSTVYEFEPSLEEVLDDALKLYLESQLMQAKIESSVSEYAMRMMAMGNANRNAGDLIDDLTLELNATRQAAITQEISEITGGANAIAN